VCVPTYNGAAFLPQALASISAQTFVDYEVLIVDDGSTDRSVDIAQTYAASDDRVRVIRNPERAGSSAKNANQCLRHARGEWIKFLYQDDVMAPHCIERMLEAGRRGRFVMSWHDYLFEPGTDDATRQMYESLPLLRNVLPTNYAGVDEFCDAVLAHWAINFIGPTSSTLIHREIFGRYGGFSDIVTLPDLEYWLRVGSHEGLAIATEPLTSFRVHGRSFSGRMRDASPAQRFRYSLELTLMICKLARAPAYENIRNRVGTHHPLIDLERRARDEALGAHWGAANGRFRSRDRGWLDAWRTLRGTHPEVQEVLQSALSEASPWTKLKLAVMERV
jgi:glycosyltransferase involved in cell wall biosynthesis